MAPRNVDSRVWIAWVLVAAAIIMIARNPLYSVVLLLIVTLVGRMCRLPQSRPSFRILRISAFILLFTTLFNGLSIHVGEHVLFRFPPWWPWIGGPVTLEAAVFGLSTGLVLVALLAAFVAFNSIMPTSDLVRLVPRAMRDLGVVLLIAITYVPETGKQLQRIKEAQAIRGHRLRGVRDWRPIIIPLLIGGLERAMTLAESMVARGYGATTDAHQPLAIQAGLVGGLALALIGWSLTFWIDWLGWMFLAGGLAVIVIIGNKLGRRFPYTRYRPRTWRRWDTILLLAVVAPMILMWLPAGIDRASLVYVPFPSLRFPTFDLLFGLSLIGLMSPALLSVLRRTRLYANH